MNSTNGQKTSERRQSNSSDDGPVHMRIGSEYQAVIPKLEKDKVAVSRGPALVIWKPYLNLDGDSLTKFIDFSRTKYGYREEQALGLLKCHRYNVEEAKQDLVNFVPYPDDWTQLEKQTFDHGFQEHGKDFHKIKMMLPDKSVSNIVKYYYIWKKTRSKYQALKSKLKSRRPDSDDDSFDDFDRKNKRIRMGSSSIMTSNFTQSQIPIIQALYNTDGGVNEACTNCHRAKAVSLVSIKKEHLLCKNCAIYYQKYATMRPLFELCTVDTDDSNEKGQLTPPQGIDLTMDTIMLVAASKDAHQYLASLTNKIMCYKVKYLEQKAQHEKMKKALNEFNVEQYRPKSPSVSMSKGWSEEEIGLLKLSLEAYGKDFEAASVIIGTKYSNQCRNYYYSKKDKLNLDECLEKYDEKQKKEVQTLDNNKKEESETKMDIDTEKEIVAIGDVQKEKVDDGEIEVISVINGNDGERNIHSPDFVFKMHINGVTQPCRLQRVPINNNHDMKPIVIDLTDDEDNCKADLNLKLSSTNENLKKLITTNICSKVVDNVMDNSDEIQIIEPQT